MNTELIARRARFLRLSALNISEGMRSGNFRSMFRGQGIEFAGVREYLHGDDVRLIDWNVTSRMGKPFIKLFNEERELTVFLIMDRSLSMETGYAARSRREQGCEAAALLAFAAEQNGSPLGAVFFHGELECVLPPRQGRDQIMTIIKHLDTPSVPLRGSVLANALAGSVRILRNRSLVIIISDFRSSGYEQQLAVLARKHDVIAVRITDLSDIHIPAAGYIPFYDPETGVKSSLPTSAAAFRHAWESRGYEHMERWTALCRKRGVYPLVMSTTDEAANVLCRFFSSREKRR